MCNIVTLLMSFSPKYYDTQLLWMALRFSWNSILSSLSNFFFPVFLVFFSVHKLGLLVCLKWGWWISICAFYPDLEGIIRVLCAFWEKVTLLRKDLPDTVLEMGEVLSASLWMYFGVIISFAYKCSLLNYPW